MSVIGCFRTATDAEIDALLANPERIRKVFDLPEPEAKPGYFPAFSAEHPKGPVVRTIGNRTRKTKNLTWTRPGMGSISCSLGNPGKALLR